MPETTEEDLEALPRGTRPRIAMLLAAGLFIVLTLVWLLSGGGTEFFRHKSNLRTFLGDSGGVSPGVYVRLNGVRVGRVNRVELADSLDPTRVVRLDIKIEDRYMSKIPSDSIAALTADNLLGDQYVNITAGKSSTPVVDGAEIASLVQSSSFNPADLVASLQATLQRVDSILAAIQQGDTPLAQFVNGEAFYNDLRAQLDSIQKTIRNYADPKTPEGRMFFSDEFYNQIRQPILNVDHALEEIQRGETRSGRLLNDPKAYDGAVTQIRKVHQSLADIAAGKGAAGPLLTSDEKYVQIQKQIRSIDQAVDRLTVGQGAFAKLLASDQLYRSLNQPSKKARSFLRELREDPRKFLRIKLR